MSEPTEQARNELSAEALAEWCETQVALLLSMQTSSRTLNVAGRMRRIAAMLRAGERCAFACANPTAENVALATAAWEAAHD